MFSTASRRTPAIFFSMPESHAKSTVWLIEDNAAFRQSVARAINRLPGLACPRHFAACEPALAALAEEKPDVVLIDVGLPGMSGIEGIPQVKAKSPETQVVVLTVFEDPDKIFDALCAGASGSKARPWGRSARRSAR
jgi:DNA-binding NarL/FixJ family response regulator